MSLNRSFDVGARLRAAAGIPNTATPSSSGAPINGATIDRHALGARYFSCKSLARGRFTGSTVQAAAVAMAFEHSSDGSSWDPYSTETNASQAFGSTGATGAQTNVDDVAEQRVNLLSARRYVRQVVTPSFAVTSSGDNIALSGVVVFGGGDENT